MVTIAATETAFPPYYYSQEQITQHLAQLWQGTRLTFDLLDRFHRNTSIQGRHLALPLERYTHPGGFGERNRAWTETAMNLGEHLVCALLERMDLAASDISQIAFTTVTGIAVPSIEARLMNRIPFSKHLKRLPLFGWGCMGGAAGIARLADYLTGHSDEAAILLSIELCSLTIQEDDLTIANVVSSGLFADGAAAVLMVGEDHPLAKAGKPRVLDSRSVFFPETEEIMGWDVRDSGFKMLLGSDVAEVVEAGLGPELRLFLSDNGLAVGDIQHWIAHPGGPKVMDAIEASLDLDSEALALSRESLASVGNLSSASVLHILKDTVNQRDPQPGSYGLLMAMGPAFSAELVLLQW